MTYLFLDIDGVLNCQLFYEERHRKQKLTFSYWFERLVEKIKFALRGFKPRIISGADLMKLPPPKFNQKFQRFKDETCPKRLRWLNDLCLNTDVVVVISSTWRTYFTVQEWNTVFYQLGCREILVEGITAKRGRQRGEEIQEYLVHNDGYDNYVIIDDDSDMLPEQMPHYFQTDNYSGLTPNTCYRIQRFINKVDEKVA